MLASALNLRAEVGEILRKGRLLSSGSGTRVGQTSLGQTVTLDVPSAKWLHPWTTRLFWLATEKRWVATVKPGFVNGKCPTYRTILKDATSDDRRFGVNPLSGEDYFSAWVFDHPKEKQPTTPVDIPLYYQPAIPLAWRALGFDGASGNGFPAFFARRGVNAAPTGSVGPTEPQNAAASQPPKGNRLLRACDIILHQPRQALTSQITLEPGPATGISNVTQTLSIRSADPGDRLKVFATQEYAPTNAAIDPLAGDYDEPNFDEVLLATVYLLSPAGTPLGSEPDGTWTAFVRHQYFWNLNYAQPQLQVLNIDPGTPFIPPLAAGAAQLVINFLTASLNDATAQALNILSAHSLSGTFYTPTGGGSSATFPDPPVTSPGLRRNKAAERAAAAAKLRAETLDPAFPYGAASFDLSLLTA